MKFQLVDAVLEIGPDRISAIKNVSAAEEYLGDHFPGFPVLPGVFMIEAMVQAARRLLEAEGRGRYVLGSVRAVRYGSLVRPGETLRVDLVLEKRLPDGAVQFKGTGRVMSSGAPAGSDAGIPPADDTAVAGRFTMRPVRLDPAA